MSGTVSWSPPRTWLRRMRRLGMCVWEREYIPGSEWLAGSRFICRTVCR